MKSISDLLLIHPNVKAKVISNATIPIFLRNGLMYSPIFHTAGKIVDPGTLGRRPVEKSSQAESNASGMTMQ